MVASAFALSAAAAAVLFTGEKASALTCMFQGGVITSCRYGVGGPVIQQGPFGFDQQWLETNQVLPPEVTYKPTDKDIWFVNGPTQETGVIEWTWNDVNGSGTWLIPPDPHSVDEWIVNVTFAPPGASSFEYVVIIDKGQGGAPPPPPPVKHRDR